VGKSDRIQDVRLVTKENKFHMTKKKRGIILSVLFF